MLAHRRRRASARHPTSDRSRRKSDAAHYRSSLRRRRCDRRRWRRSPSSTRQRRAQSRLGRQTPYQLPAAERPVLQLLRSARPVQRRGRRRCTSARGRCRRMSATRGSPISRSCRTSSCTSTSARTTRTTPAPAGDAPTSATALAACAARTGDRHALPDEQQHLGPAQRLLLSRPAVVSASRARVASREPESAANQLPPIACGLLGDDHASAHRAIRSFRRFRHDGSCIATMCGMRSRPLSRYCRLLAAAAIDGCAQRSCDGRLCYGRIGSCTVRWRRLLLLHGCSCCDCGYMKPIKRAQWYNWNRNYAHTDYGQPTSRSSCRRPPTCKPTTAGAWPARGSRGSTTSSSATTQASGQFGGPFRRRRSGRSDTTQFGVYQSAARGSSVVDVA